MAGTLAESTMRINQSSKEVKTEAPTRLEKLLALLVLKVGEKSTQQEKVVLLSKAGFSNQEIADLLETKANIVAQHLYAARSAKASNKTGRAKRGADEKSWGDESGRQPQ